GGRRNVPRPSHGDISCSGSGTRGVEQILLDDHHINDDDEGLELIEPGVKPSNAIRSNIFNPLPNPADRLMISPSADKFDDQIADGHAITSIFQFKLSEPWATWESITTSKERPDVASFQ
nr:hypothetical protein [Tanacetum cinerariifolium]